MATYSTTGTTAGRKINSMVAFAFGAVFVVVGLLGFTVSGGHHVAGTEGGELLGLFQVNVLHNFVHLAAGAVLIGSAIASARAAKVANTLFGVVYLAVGAIGLFLVGTSANIIALNGADNGLHLVLGTVLLGVGLGADRAKA
jgi:hypothetical protein